MMVPQKPQVHWIHLRLPSSCHGFESQAHTIYAFIIYSQICAVFCLVKRTKNKAKRGRIWPISKSVKSKQLFKLSDPNLCLLINLKWFLKKNSISCLQRDSNSEQPNRRRAHRPFDHHLKAVDFNQLFHLKQFDYQCPHV